MILGPESKLSTMPLCCILLIHFFFGRAIWQRMLLPEAACDYENDCESTTSCKGRSIYCTHLILVTVRKVYITLAIRFSFLALCVSLYGVHIQSHWTRGYLCSMLVGVKKVHTTENKLQHSFLLF